MSSRPRRSAAKKASEALVDWADSERTSSMSTRARRSEGRPSGVSRDPPSSPGSEHLNLTVKVPSNKLREATTGRGRNSTGNSIAVNSRGSFGDSEIVSGRRNRGPKKSYVVESDSEEEDEEMEDPNDEDADGDEDDMDVDAEGDDDAEGDADMDTPAAPSTIKIQLPKPGKVTPRRPAAARVIEDDDDDDEEELSEIEVSDPENTMDMSIDVGGAGDDDDDDEEEDEDEEDAEGEDEDAEGDEEDAEGEEEEIEVADETQGLDAEGGEELDSEDGSREGTPDLSKMTRRQRARFEDEPQQYMKLSDEVQAKKVFTAEELSMRRAEMARRRRNLSEKRNEEVKMETINKLLKKQAPKTKGKGGAGGEDTPNNEPPKPDAAFVRWVSSKKGTIVAVPGEMLGGPTGKAFIPGGLKSGKMVEEVA
ncbi:INO80 complex subunit 2 [Colletotrichum trifolii]|uniref:INO80 complex subunit 2 n=1 Tax=Colletotrichum trifolii TaxID=5466 RepID=A0A4R8QSP7_COLTR|nr:INO80 complex subunit 2 [Colletotrichum trifolii]